MPKISVTEKDLSWYLRQRESGTATVYLPGIATFGPENVPTLCDSSNFANTFGTGAVNIMNEISYDMAASFIKSGFNVLFHRVPLTGAAKATATVENEGQTSHVTFSAKYTGSFGNRITLTVRPLNATPGSISVYVLVDNVVVDTLIVNLITPTSPYYYQNLVSEYITIEYVGEFSELNFGTSAKPLELSLAGGLDFTAGTDSDAVRQEVWSSIKTPGFCEVLKDPYQYDYDVIVSGGWSLYNKAPEVYEGTGEDGQPTTVGWDISKIDLVDAALFDLAVARGTSVFLVDGDPDWEDAEMYAYCGLFNSSYAAGYGPWGYAQLLSTGTTLVLPGSYAMIISWAQSCANGTPIWMAPAGVKRATLGSFYKDTKYTVGKRTLDMWQNHDYIKPGQYSVNPIMKAKQYGYVVYGNSTLLQSTPSGATSMLQAFSVRILSNVIKVKAFDISLNLQFDQLSNDLYAQFRTLMITFMDQLKYQGALYDYDIALAQETLTSVNLNEKKLPIIIRISPNPSADDFDITLEITQSGVSFADDTDENEIS